MPSKQKWTVHDIPDLTGKTIIVTGANSGLGYETTCALASKHATIIMACRNPEKAKNAEEKIKQQIPGAKL